LNNTRFNHRQVWQLALPMIIANISTPLLGLVDTAVMGHLDNASFLAAQWIVERLEAVRKYLQQAP
jgi:MATE family multidrug resistance protein